MANESSTMNFMDSILDAQKNWLDSASEQAKKISNGNNLVNETIEKGHEWYESWIENQKKVFATSGEKVSKTAETARENASGMNEFFNNWYNTQMEFGKNIWESTQNALKDATKTNPTNPMEWFNNNAPQNWMGQWNNMFNQSTNGSNWMMNNPMQAFGQTNPFSFDAWKNTPDMNKMFNQWNQTLTSNFNELQGKMQSGNPQDMFRNMLSSTESFTRFYEMWAPMWKSIQDKTFNTEMYRKMVNPAEYQQFIDKFFGFLPENARQHMQQMSKMMQDGMRQMGTQGVNGFQQFRGMFSTMPGFSGQEMFGNMLSAYTQMQTMMQEAVSPISRMVTRNEHTKRFQDWQDIADRTMVYNIKNAQLQYMMYARGTKVMDALADSVLQKIEKGEEVKSVMAMYQEWLSISDKQYVGLFESDEYSQLMAEVSAMQLKLRKDMEGQMEQMMSNIPVATRSEMDEMYKTIYDLKKEVRQLGKMLDLDQETATTPVMTATAPVAESAPTATETFPTDSTAKSTTTTGKNAKKA
jgi:polyhydroxyalkanoate synthase subunit PhaE